MSNFFSRHRQHVGIVAFTSGMIFTILACGLLVHHTRQFALKRDTAVMIGTTLPELKSSVALLEANTEAEKLFVENALASREELADVYILPDTSPGSRTVEVLTQLAQAIGTNGDSKLSVENVTFPHAPPADTGVREYPVLLILRGNYQSVASLLGILTFAGDMMVKDVLSLEAEDMFLRTVESVAPLSLRDAQNFLYLDLLAYLAEPDARESRAFKDIPAVALPDLRSLLLHGGLADARRAFGPVAPELLKKNVWPFPLLTVDTVTRSGDRWTIGLTAYGR